MINNNLNVLPFYKDINDQDYKKWYAFKEVYALPSPKNKILPFQIARPHRANNITSVRLYKMGSTAFTNITTQIVAAGLHIMSFADYDLIVNPSLLVFPDLTITQGQDLLTLFYTCKSRFFLFIKHLTK